MISIEHVTKSFSGSPVVKDLTVHAAAGEILGLVGPNGAGKTTTIKMMTGLARPDDGSIRIGGHDIVTDPVKAKSVLGYVPDKPFLYEKLTGREFLLFTAAIYGMTRADAGSRTEFLMDRFGIGDQADNLIEGFSQGMRQRLLFAAALVHRPRVLLIDEPFVGLDPFGVHMITSEISAVANAGAAVFLATHSLHIAEALCHRVGFIRKGTLVAVRNIDEVRAFDGGLEGLFMSLGA